MSTFTTFVGLMKSQKWADAAADIKTTLWCSQTGSRCTRNAAIIAAGCNSEVELQAGNFTVMSILPEFLELLKDDSTASIS